VLSWQQDTWSRILNEAARDGVFLILIWFLFRLINYVEKKMKANQFGHRKYDVTTVEGIAKISRVVLFTLAILAILQSAGVPLTAIYTVAGGAGLGISLAAQDLLKNFFGGLVLYFDRPFVVGDWVKSPDREIGGSVQHIGWRITCILTADRQPLYVPNSTFLTISVQNSSRTIIGDTHANASKD
jgi:MscS family membrane protein